MAEYFFIYTTIFIFQYAGRKYFNLFFPSDAQVNESTSRRTLQKQKEREEEIKLVRDVLKVNTNTKFYLTFLTIGPLKIFN